MKKLLSVLISAVSLCSSVFLFTSCSKECKHKNVVTDERVEATCTETGLTEGSHCEDCNTVIVAQEIIGKKNHTPAAAVKENNVEPTCSDSGRYDSVIKCSVCASEISRTENIVEKLDHTSSEWIVDKAADCTHNGSRHKECTVCEEILEYEVTDKLAHTSSDWIVDVVSGCDNNGARHKECTVCEEILEIDVTDKSAHTPSEWITDVAADCAHNGGRHKECTVCHAILEFETTDKLDHTSGDWITDVAADCAHNGSRHKECTVCKEILEFETTDKLDHTSGDWITDVEADCTHNGSKHKECTVCGAVLEIADIPALTEHNFTEPATVEAVGSFVGYTEKHCTICGYSETDSYNFDLYSGIQPAVKSKKTIDFAQFSESEFTIELSLLLPKSYNDRGGVLLGNYYNGKTDALNIEVYSNGTPRVYYINNGKASDYRFKTDIRSDSVISVAFVQKGGRLSLFVNGELAETIKANITLSGGFLPYAVGSDMRTDNTQYFKGTLYKLNVFGEARTAQEIKNDILFVNPQENALIAGYNFLNEYTCSDFGRNGLDLNEKLSFRVSTVEELEIATALGAAEICIVNDIVIDRTLYIVSDTTIVSETDCTLTRAENFAGDLFVVGENSAGRNLILDNVFVKLHLGASGNKITIDGNSENMTVPVTGSAFFICNSAYLNVYDNVSVINCEKTGNVKTLKSTYFLSHQEAIGGAVAVIASGTMNIYGGLFDNNAVNTADTEPAISTEGGAIFNFSVLNVYGGTFTNNKALKGGVIYNYRMARIYGGTFTDNLATKYGGVSYLAGSQYAELIIGEVNSTFNEQVLIENNRSDGSGGAIFSQVENTVLIYDCAVLRNNSAGSNGGAINASGSLTVFGSIFEGNVSESSTSKGGAIYSYYNDDTVSVREVNITGTKFIGNESRSGGAVAFMPASSDMPCGVPGFLTDCLFEDNKANDYGGAVYIHSNSKVTIENCVFNRNVCEGTGNGGAIYISSKNGDSRAYINNSYFTENTAKNNGGAVYLSGDGCSAYVNGSTFESNHADTYGGVAYFTGPSDLVFTNNVAIKNSAKYGGVLYGTTTNTTALITGLTVDSNTASKGPIFYGNANKVYVTVDKNSWTDVQQEVLDNAYWSAAFVNKYTLSDYKEPVIEEAASEVVDVDVVFALAQNSSQEDINPTYAHFERLDNSSNFMSQSVTEFENINGKTVTVDTFTYHPNIPKDNPNVGEGLMIYQAMAYKKAFPDKEVSIHFSTFRFAVSASICLNRDSRYFGYLRNLYGMDYDEYGFVRVAYLLSAAASMGIHVTLIGEMDSYPISSSDPTFLEYFTDRLNDKCDPEYVPDGKISDYLNFQFSYWLSYNEKSATDMMHTKLCAISNYLDKDGVVHGPAVWMSSTNLDGLDGKGLEGNNNIQTAVIITDHDEIYRISCNYLNLIAQYCKQEEIYQFREVAINRAKAQIDLIQAGKEYRIPQDEQIVYLGGENDDVFEMYFTPFANSANCWDEVYNPYCKYLRELANSEGYIEFTWSNPKYGNDYNFCKTVTDLVSKAFHEKADPQNKLYVVLPSFPKTPFKDLVVGETIGTLSINQKAYGGVHLKDILMSYVKDGQRYYVSLLNSLNIHQGSMNYQSNQFLVIKEKELTENSVYFNFADLTSKGIVEHGYGEFKTVESTCSEAGYIYHDCLICGKREIVSVLDKLPHTLEENWTVQKEAENGKHGIRFKKCTVCNAIAVAEEFDYVDSELVVVRSMNHFELTGMTFTANDLVQLNQGSKNAAFTIEAVIQLSPDMYNRGGVILGNFCDLTTDAFSFEIYSNGCPRVYYQVGSAAYSYIFTTDIRSYESVHIAITVENTAITLFVNGEKVETIQRTGAAIVATENSLVVGGDHRSGNTSYFKGTIYSVCMFNGARSETDIAKDYIMVSSDADNLVSYYPELK